MQAYLEIIVGISKLPVHNKLAEVEKHSQVQVDAARKLDRQPLAYVRPFQISKGITIPKAMVRLFSERHVTRQLRELAGYYTQLRQTIPADERNAGNLEWLGQAAEGSRAFAESLFAWGKMRSLLKSLWGALTVLALTIGLPTVVGVVLEQGLEVWVTVALPIVWIGVYAMFFVTDAFALKREFFLPGVQYLERSKELPVITHDVYRTEADVFRLMSRVRKPEFPWDHVTRLVVLVLFIGALATVTISTVTSWIGRALLIVGSVAMLGSVAAPILRQLATRLKQLLR